MVAAPDNQPTAFRNAEKRYQLHREQQIRISKGRKQGGKCVVIPTDFSKVLDLQSPTTETAGVSTTYSTTLGKTVHSLTRHPGCHILPALLSEAQQRHLFEQALDVFPEPPNRSNLTLQYGRLSSLWAAAQQGLFYAGNQSKQVEQAQTARRIFSNYCSSALYPSRLSLRADAATTTNDIPPYNSDNTEVLSHDALAILVDEASQPSSSSSPFSLPPQHHGNTSTADHTQSQSEQALLRNSSESALLIAAPGHTQIGQSSWSSDPVGPSAASLIKKLRWVALGPQFNWSTRQYEHEPGAKPLPHELMTLAQEVVQACDQLHAQTRFGKYMSTDRAPDLGGLHQQYDVSDSKTHSSGNGVVNGGCSSQETAHVPYEPNTALVNFYREGDTLGGHKDDAELLDTCPIVSLSLGCDGVFLMGGSSKDVEPTAVWVRSGDVIVLSGPARQCYHGVPRVMPGQLAAGKNKTCTFSGDMADQMQATRVNISIRQT